jgi:rRNA maturation endonuclease Nob1
MVKTTNPVAENVEALRQLVIAARADATVGPAADECLNRLNQLHADDPTAFTTEDVRFVNVLRGYLGIRLAAHQPAAKHAKKAKRKGDKLDHCWRCETPVDERFTDICPDCDSKAYHWRVCPVCTACGCQRAGGRLV